MLAPHVQSFQPGVLEWVLRCKPDWLKVMHPDRPALAEVKRQFPACQIWFRRYFPGQLLDAPEQRAREAAEAVMVDLRGVLDLVEWVSSYNETGLFGEAERYCDFEQEFTRQMHAEGLKAVSYNFSVGQPPLEDWPKYLPIPGDALGLNQYHAPMMDSPGHEWTLLRHTKVREATGYTGPILVGETGIDRGVIGETLAGWRASGIGVDEYCRQLRWAAERFRETGVTAAFVFNAGGWGWASFETANEPAIAETLANLPRTAATMPAVIPPESALATRYGPGFARALSEYADLVGTPVGERVDIATSQHAPSGSDPYRFSHLLTTNGTLLWRKSDNSMGFWAFGGRFYEFTSSGLRSTR